MVENSCEYCGKPADYNNEICLDCYEDDMDEAYEDYLMDKKVDDEKIARIEEKYRKRSDYRSPFVDIQAINLIKAIKEKKESE